MPWPLASDYSEAVQNPAFCFADADLRSGVLTLDALGMPKPISGAFASVYQMSGSGRRWAVRCFLREFADQQRRYAAISSHLRAANLSAMVGFDYLTQGIKIRGKWYPILKMEWVEGEPLDRYVARHVGQRQALQALARRWIDLMAVLRKAQIAHGDLQHGNVLVANGTLRLIDYDGMFVPALAGLASHEEGHRNYQHPSRTGRDFGLFLDNFSAWVIFHSLSALAVDGRLWQLLDGGDEHLLFRREDYQHPASSKALHTLERSGKLELQALAAHFRALMYLPLGQIPPLDGVSASQGSSSPPRGVPTGLPEWLSDQVQEAKAEALTTPPNPIEDEPQPSVAGAAWLADHLLGDRPLPPILPDGRLWVERIMCGSAMLVILLAAAVLPLRLLPVWVSVIVIVVTPTGLLGGLFGRYRSKKLVSEKRSVAGRHVAAQQALRRTERAIHGVQEERKRFSMPMADLDEKYRSVPKALNDQLTALQHALSESIASLAGRRTLLDAQENAAVRTVAQKAQESLNLLLQQRSSLDQSERNEVQQALEQARRQHVEQFLANTWVANAELVGIGPKLKARLQAGGIVSAADVTSYRVQGVSGFGVSKAYTLQIWRMQVEQQAAATAPQSLPHHQSSQIRVRFVGLRQSLDVQIEAATQQERRERQVILDRFATSRAELERAEAEARAEYHRNCEAARVKSRREQEQLRAAFEAVKFRVAAEKKMLDAQLAELNRHAFQERLKECELKREVARYRAVSFAEFVRKSFSSGNAA